MSAHERNWDADFDIALRKTREVLHAELGERLYKTWIEHLQLVAVDETRVVFSCTTHFERDRIWASYGERMAELLTRFSGVVRTVELIVEPTLRATVPAPAPQPAIDTGWAGDASIAEPALVAGSVPLDRRLTFANFVAGAGNQTAFAVAQAVANGDGRTNPLFIFGQTGLGKTHLLQAVVWRILERDPGKRVLYLTSEAFTRGFLSSLRANELLSFKNLVRGVDVLCCDDVQFLGGKTATVEEFFHTFEELLAHGKQIILSADRSPQLLDQIPERLRSRLINCGGVEIQGADLDTRFAILRAKAKRRAHDVAGFQVGDDVLRMMAARIQSDARALDGALSRLQVNSDRGETITFQKAEALLHDFLHKHNRKVTLGELKVRVASHYNVTPRDLESTSRKREFVRARQTMMYLARMMTGKSYPEIGQSLARDHTTIMYGFEKVRDQYAADPQFKDEIDRIQKSIRDWPNDGD